MSCDRFSCFLRRRCLLIVPAATALFAPVDNSSINRSVGFSTATVNIPSAVLNAVSTDWVKRSRSVVGLTMIRSTTISMLCHLFLLSMISSLSSTTSPSTRARTNPERRALSNIAVCSPFLCLTTGASNKSLEPSSNRVIESTICCTVCRCTGWPQFRQWGRPARANNNLR